MNTVCRLKFYMYKFLFSNRKHPQIFTYAFEVDEIGKTFAGRKPATISLKEFEDRNNI